MLGAFDLCLKCSHLFNILDARGAISVTERVGVIARIRALAVGVAKAYVDQQKAGDRAHPVAKNGDEDGAPGKAGTAGGEQIVVAHVSHPVVNGGRQEMGQPAHVIQLP